MEGDSSRCSEVVVVVGLHFEEEEEEGTLSGRKEPPTTVGERGRPVKAEESRVDGCFPLCGSISGSPCP